MLLKIEGKAMVVPPIDFASSDRLPPESWATSPATKPASNAPAPVEIVPLTALKANVPACPAKPAADEISTLAPLVIAISPLSEISWTTPPLATRVTSKKPWA